MSITTLKDLRQRSGLSIADIVSRMNDIEPRSPKFRPGLIHLEKRGTDKNYLIKALAAVYELDPDEVELAATNSREASTKASKNNVTEMATLS